MGRLTLLGLACLVFLLWTAATPVRADTVTNTTKSPSWNGSSHAGEFGVDALNEGECTYGETVTVPSSGGTFLKSFGFEMDVPTDLTFRAEVYAWDSVNHDSFGSHATGTSLYQSGPTHTTSFTAGGASGYQLITFSPSGLDLTAGDQYILMVTCSVDYTANSNANSDNGAGDGFFGSPGNIDAYTGGQFWTINDQGTTSLWTSNAGPEWIQPPQFDDLAFTADFSTPLPSTLLGGAVLLAGLALLVGHRTLR